jgi:hypothetical protein
MYNAGYGAKFHRLRYDLLKIPPERFGWLFTKKDTIIVIRT